MSLRQIKKEIAHLKKLFNGSASHPDYLGERLVHEASAEKPRLSKCRRLIEKGAAMDKTAAGWSCLQWAVNKESNLVRLLVDAGADVHVRDHDGTTLFDLALANDKPVQQTQILRYLTDGGLDIDTPGYKGLTAVEHAFKYGQVKSAEWLVRKGADMSRVIAQGVKIFSIGSPAFQDPTVNVRLYNLIQEAKKAKDTAQAADKKTAAQLKRYFNAGGGTGGNVTAARRGQVMQRRLRG